jgi:RNA methyltransferase, TrmH family
LVTDLVRLEGFHALKHALRFGAEIVHAEGDVAQLERLAAELARDIAPRIGAVVRHVPGADCVATAVRPHVCAKAVLARPAPVVLLERPRHLGNVGACVRAAAAAGAAGVLTTGDADPWHPHALRGSAGLHFAVPVRRVAALPDTARPLVAVDPGGEELRPGTIPADAILAFGTERRGLSPELLARADRRLRLPMELGVSSLNLATAVAAVLYAWRLWQGSPGWAPSSSPEDTGRSHCCSTPSSALAAATSAP